MRRFVSSLVVIAFLCLSGAAVAQDAMSSATATCNFDDDKQLATEYQRVTVNLKKPLLGHEIPSGKVWAPGGKPMTLFTNTPIVVGGKQLAAGAYTMFVIPTAKQWTLIISRNLDISGKYYETMDLVRVPMEPGELPAPESQFTVSFAHVAPDQCSLRLEVATVGTDVMFERK